MNAEAPFPLESYATVIAALDAGLPLSRALFHASISAAQWDAGSDHWQQEIQDSAAGDLSVLVGFDVALLQAKRRFSPTPEPIASDARAFAHFRRHLLFSVEPASFIAKAQMTLSAYARLEGEWASRAAGDAQVAAALKTHMEDTLGPCPEITMTPPKLEEAHPVSASPVTSPLGPQAGVPVAPDWDASMTQTQDEVRVPEPPPTLPNRATQEPAPSAIQSTPFSKTIPSAVVPPLPLERYAVMLADATHFRLTEEQLCNKHNITVPAKTRAFEFWGAVAGNDASVAQRIAEVEKRYVLHAKRSVTPMPSATVTLDLPAPDRATLRAALGVLNRSKTGPLNERLDGQALGDNALPFEPAASPMSERGLSPSPADDKHADIPRTVVFEPPPLSAKPKSSLGATLPSAPEPAGTMVFDGNQVAAALPFDPPVVEGIGFDAYARIRAELANEADRAAVLRRNQIDDEAHYARIHTGWQHTITERKLSARYVALFAEHHERIRSKR